MRLLDVWMSFQSKFPDTPRTLPSNILENCSMWCNVSAISPLLSAATGSIIVDVIYASDHFTLHCKRRCRCSIVLAKWFSLISRPDHVLVVFFLFNFNNHNLTNLRSTQQNCLAYDDHIYQKIQLNQLKILGLVRKSRFCSKYLWLETPWWSRSKILTSDCHGMGSIPRQGTHPVH